MAEIPSDSDKDFVAERTALDEHKARRARMSNLAADLVLFNLHKGKAKIDLETAYSDKGDISLEITLLSEEDQGVVICLAEDGTWGTFPCGG